MGLMQLMPMTAHDTDPKTARAQLVQVEANIRIGAKYLKKLYDRFGGNWVYAIAGYNGGPHSVQRWLREGKQNRGMMEFIETIPFKETREYVTGIIRNYYWYSKRLGLPGVKPLSYFWAPEKVPATPPPSESKPVATPSPTENKPAATPSPIESKPVAPTGPADAGSTVPSAQPSGAPDPEPSASPAPSGDEAPDSVGSTTGKSGKSS
jgi:hypothetical protein